MTPTSSTDQRHAGAPASQRLLATIAVALLALGGIALVDVPTTGALYSDDATAALTGFQVQPLCDFDAYESPGELVAALSPALHWGFAPGTGPWSDEMGGPVSSAPDGTLLCDDGVLTLSAAQAVWSSSPAVDPVTVLLVLGTPTTPGRALTLAEPGGPGIEVQVTASAATVRAWDAGVPAVDILSVPLDPAQDAHVLALEVTGTAASLWVDGGSAAGAVPVALGSPVLGLGAVPGTEPDGETPTSAAFTATELALVPGAVAGSELSAILASATAP